MPRKVTVRVLGDHLERMSHVRKPALAVAELVWNGLDADASEVSVAFSRNAIGGLDSIVVTDNGHGMKLEDAIPAFENLGGSWKRGRTKSRGKQRLLHGKAGKGRFRAFALGGHVRWSTRFSDNGSVSECVVEGTRANFGTFYISDPQPSAASGTGTIVTISGVEKNFPSLFGPAAIQEITEYFALYLRQYPEVAIRYDGHKIEPSSVENNVAEYTIGPVTLEDGHTCKADLTVIEWNVQTERSMVLCDASGFALSEIPPGIQATGFSFTAYLKSDFLRKMEEEGLLVLDELHPDIDKLIEAAKDGLREHFRTRTAEASVDLVEEWKKEEIYPYKGEAATVLEKAERQVFDVLALNLNTYLPDFDKTDKKSKTLSLRLLKQALEQSPKAVQRILEDVLDLPKEKQDEFAELLERTTLAAVINAARVVADRLDFLKGLELLVFEHKEVLLERQQLHKILTEQTWIFGEEFNLTVNDQSLTEVLRKHLQLLGRTAEELEALAKVVREDGRKGIVDMLLSRLVPQPRADEREHLVVELKRPSQPVDASVVTQIKEYAFAVAADERFRDTKTRWVFWVLSNDMSDGVRRESRQRNRPEGLLYEDEEQRITIWVKTWGQVIESCRARLKFFQERLEFNADRDSGLDYLRKTHAKYLPKDARPSDVNASNNVPPTGGSGD